MSETINLGLTLEVPSTGETNWGESFKTDFAEPISEHQHTGSGDGLQLVTASIADNAITGAKIRLENNVALRARNAANSADINLIKLNTSNQAEFAGTVTFTGGVSFTDVTSFAGTAIGSDLQAWSARLDEIALLSPLANNFIVGTGSSWTRANPSDVRTALGLVIGLNVQAWDANLDQIAALSPLANNFIIGDGSNWVRGNQDDAAAAIQDHITELTTCESISVSGVDLTISGNSGDEFIIAINGNKATFSETTFSPTSNLGYNLGSASNAFNGISAAVVEAPTSTKLQLKSNGATDVELHTNGSPRWVIQGSASNAFVPSGNRIVDIGLNNTNEVNNIYAAAYLNFSGCHSAEQCDVDVQPGMAVYIDIADDVRTVRKATPADNRVIGIYRGQHGDYHHILALGDTDCGDIVGFTVSNESGFLSDGDLLVTGSNGFLCKQADDIRRSNTVGKVIKAPTSYDGDGLAYNVRGIVCAG